MSLGWIISLQRRYQETALKTTEMVGIRANPEHMHKDNCCVERTNLWHWEQVRFLLAGGRWPVKQTVEQKSCVEPFLWNAVWPLSRTCSHETERLWRIALFTTGGRFDGSIQLPKINHLCFFPNNYIYWCAGMAVCYFAFFPQSTKWCFVLSMNSQPHQCIYNTDSSTHFPLGWSGQSLPKCLRNYQLIRWNGSSGNWTSKQANHSRWRGLRAAH